MALSSPGIGSGLDIQGIVQKLMAVEQQPLAKISARVVELKAQVSAYGALKGAVSSFRDALQKLSDLSKFKAYSATSSDTAVLGATASTTAARGTYNIDVQRLAENHRMAADTAFAGSDSVVGTTGDRMRITVGGNAFEIEHGGKSLAAIRDEINAAADNTGVTASLIRDDVGYRLTLSSNGVGSSALIGLEFSDGAANAIADPFSMATLNQDRDGLGGPIASTSGLAFDPAGTAASGIDAGALTINGIQIDAAAVGDGTLGGLANQLVAAINARSGEHGVTASVVVGAGGSQISLAANDGSAFSLTVDGAVDPDISAFFADGTTSVASTTDPNPAFAAADLDAAVMLEGRFKVTSTSNTLSDAVQGVTINLKKTGSATLTVDRDTATVQASVQELAKSYSDLVALMGKMRGDVLKSDSSTLSAIENQMRAVLNSRVEGLGTLGNAFEAGLSTQKNGSLTVNSTMLAKVIEEDFDGLAKLFADPAQGLAKRLFDLADGYLATGGLLDGRSLGLDRQVRESEAKRTGVEERLKLVEARLLSTYTNLDLVVSRLQGTNTALTSQLAGITNFYKINGN